MSPTKNPNHPAPALMILLCKSYAAVFNVVSVFNASLDDSGPHVMRTCIKVRAIIDWDTQVQLSVFTVDK